MKGFRPPPSMAAISSEPLPITRTITITEGISVKDLAEKLGVRAKEVIARLLSRGVFATINQTLDSALASDMSRHFGADTNVISFEQWAPSGPITRIFMVVPFFWGFASTRALLAAAVATVR